MILLCFPPTVKEALMLGAVGAYEWSGTVIQEIAAQTITFPSQAFGKILQDRNQSSYLGEDGSSR